MAIKLADDTITREDLNELSEWIQSNPRLTKGPLTLELEAKFAKLIGTKHSVFVNSGSSANLLMFYALIHKGILKFNKKVVIPAISWATDLAPAIQFGLEPILCDCNLTDLSVSIKHLEEIFIKEKPAALLLVSVLGLAPNMNLITELCEKYHVYLIEDNCESLLTTYDDKNLGTFGGMSSFSTFFGHHISTIEGGFITTDSDDDYELLCMLRSHGWSRDISDKSKREMRDREAVDEFDEFYTFYIPGFNVRNTEIGAFLGLKQLEKIQDYLKIRIDNAKYFYYHLNHGIDYGGWSPCYIPTFALPLIFPTKNRRDSAVKALNAKNIECRPLIAGNMAKQPMYYKNCKHVDLPNANIVHTRGMYLPNHQGLTHDDMKQMVEIVIDAGY